MDAIIAESSLIDHPFIHLCVSPFKDSAYLSLTEKPVVKSSGNTIRSGLFTPSFIKLLSILSKLARFMAGDSHSISQLTSAIFIQKKLCCILELSFHKDNLKSKTKITKGTQCWLSFILIVTLNTVRRLFWIFIMFTVKKIQDNS